MALGEIKHNIDEQAKKEARGIHEGAAKEKESIMGDANARARAITQGVESEISAELKRLSEENEASIELESKNIRLSAREEAIDGEIAKVKRLLAREARKSGSYDRLFRQAAKQALDIAPMDELTVVVSRPDRPKVEKLGAKIEIQGISGGLMIKSRKGDIAINATLDALIDSKTEEIRNAVLDAMFGQAKARPAGAAKAPRRLAKAGARARAKRKNRK